MGPDCVRKIRDTMCEEERVKLARDYLKNELDRLTIKIIKESSLETVRAVILFLNKRLEEMGWGSSAKFDLQVTKANGKPTLRVKELLMYMVNYDSCPTPAYRVALINSLQKLGNCQIPDMNVFAILLLNRLSQDQYGTSNSLNNICIIHALSKINIHNIALPQIKELMTWTLLYLLVRTQDLKLYDIATSMLSKITPQAELLTRVLALSILNPAFAPRYLPSGSSMDAFRMIGNGISKEQFDEIYDEEYHEAFDKKADTQTTPRQECKRFAQSVYDM